MKDREIFWSCAQTGLHTTSLSHITLHYKLLMSFKSIATMKCDTKWCACPKIVRVSEHLCWGAIGNTLSRKFRKCHSPVIQLSAYFHWSFPAVPASLAHLASTHLCTQLPLLTCNQPSINSQLHYLASTNLDCPQFSAFCPLPGFQPLFSWFIFATFWQITCLHCSSCLFLIELSACAIIFW